MAVKEVTVEELWGTASRIFKGWPVPSKEKLEQLATTEGGIVGPVQKRHVGGQFSVFETVGHGRRPVAYECGHCHSIVVGPPVYKNEREIVATDESGYSAGAGVVASDIYCGKCDSLMYGSRE